MNSLWGDEFNIEEDDIKSIVKKTKTKKVVKEVSVETKLKSKSVSVYEKIDLIKKDVDKILGHYKEDTVCIRDYNEFIKYIDAALDKKIIAVDTETNNTLNTINCKLMGLCLYVPGQKNAYIPVNHCNFELDEDGNVKQLDKLDNQVTEDQIREQLSRLVGNVKMIFHNASFDIEVIKSTCGIRLKADWDTLLGAKLLDENELAGLKAQYKIHIDPEQDKYSIEHLFKGLPYAIFDPELFALYAATDAKMCYDLWCWQCKEFNKCDIITIEDDQGVFEVDINDEIETPAGYIKCNEITDGSEILVDEGIIKVNKIVYKMNKLLLKCC